MPLHPIMTVAFAALLWLSGSAQAQTAAIVGDGAVLGNLAAREIPTAILTPGDVESDGLPDVDVVIIGDLLPDGPSEAFVEQIATWTVEQGGGLVLYWDAAAMLFDAYEAEYRFPNAPQLGWYSGTVGGGVNLVERSPLAVLESGHDLWETLDDEFPWEGAPQFFVTIDNADPLLEIVGVFRGDGSRAFPGGSYPAVMAGRVCASRVVLMPLNVHEVLASPHIDTLVALAWRWAAEPAGPRRGPCPPAPDMDGDDILAPHDNCPDDPNPAQTDTDGDGIGDDCDPCLNDPVNDEDDDGLCADRDNCPSVANPEQEDLDEDGRGDPCDGCPAIPGGDDDNDDRCPDRDNCPDHRNPDQIDSDGDGEGDACDLDRDGDGLSNDDEIAAGTSPDDADSDEDGVLDGAEPDWNVDTDGDGHVNADDHDSDGDGLSDGLELGVRVRPAATLLAAGLFTPDADPETTTDPLVRDTDGGGVDDGEEDVIPNGRRDPGETDPNDPTDDRVPSPPDAGPADTGTPEPPAQDAGVPDVGVEPAADAATGPRDTGADVLPADEADARVGPTPLASGGDDGCALAGARSPARSWWGTARR